MNLQSKSLTFLLTTFLISGIVRGQCSIDTLGYLNEISNIQFAYLDLNCRISGTTYKESFEDGAIKSRQYNFSGLVFGKYHIVGYDSGAAVVLREISNSDYKISIYEKDSAVSITPHEDIYAKTLLPALFQSGALDTDLASVCGKDTLTYSRKLTFFFKEQSYYKSFSILYDTATYYVRSVEMKLKDPGNPSGHSLYVRSIFDVEIQPIPQIILIGITQSGLYFTTQNGRFLLKEPYTNYYLLNNPIPETPDIATE